MKKNEFLKVIAVAALLAVSLAFVGCGDDDGGGSTTPAFSLADGTYTVVTTPAATGSLTTGDIYLGADGKIYVKEGGGAAERSGTSAAYAALLAPGALGVDDAFKVASKKVTEITTDAAGSGADLSSVPNSLFGATLKVIARAAVTLPALAVNTVVTVDKIGASAVAIDGVSVTAAGSDDTVITQTGATALELTSSDATAVVEITKSTLAVTIGTAFPASITVKKEASGVAITAAVAAALDISDLTDAGPDTVVLSGEFAFTLTVKADGGYTAGGATGASGAEETYTGATDAFEYTVESSGAAPTLATTAATITVTPAASTTVTVTAKDTTA